MKFRFASSLTALAIVLLSGSVPASASDDHWSLASEVIPADVTDAVAHGLGRTLIGKEPVTDLNHVVFGVLVFAILVVLMVLAAVKMRSGRGSVIPEARFSPLALFQFLSDALLGLMEGLMGREKALYFLPLIGSLGIFILFSNLLGLIPGFLPPTSNLNTTLALGLVVFFATHYYGVKTHGIGYFKEFFGPIIKWYALPLMLLMFCIEMISHIARPVSLAIRLFGNMFGDHAALAAFLLMAAGTLAGGPWIARVSVVMPLIPMVLGIFVAVVQTLVFCILSTVYIYMATEEHGEGDAHHA
ncbi:MAG TPA: F0F1 ATP synthase subunit A [Myxococcota bacterium]|mgnify:CR=1 FL=1|nr:F0F1 ATP synthase subunit A [Myxococcota bacterium]HOA12803.1 F0F1 ATP synthase subunit A [Myxococcota bacterium]HOC99166.1 F0F1 ATP synthase subunit A [Myxococcota bacterium]HOH76507.1 F0F1 ATP synthase subunit A [Myxococcota bacterium]HPV05175.1 F0F1 ATP synthase subunit A [Myxococcota bacterium]